MLSQSISSWSILTALIALLSAVDAQYVAITGVKTGINTATGARPFRKNIMDLTKDVPSWYVLLPASNDVDKLTIA